MSDPNNQESRWTVAVTWRGADSVRAELAGTVDDLGQIGGIVTGKGPAGWSTAYLCITTLADTSAWQAQWDKADDDERRHAAEADAKAAAA